jgi:hypothetical protein
MLSLLTCNIISSEDELMYGHRKGISDTVSIISVPGKEWFSTNFDRGFGERFYYRGKVKF